MEEDPDAKEALDRWTRAETGYPFIDAIMKQLRQEGMHVKRTHVCMLAHAYMYVYRMRVGCVQVGFTTKHDTQLRVF